MTSPIRLLKDWNLHPVKQLGQNFLKDPSTAEMILDRAGISPQDVILEIGAGLGALTVPAARQAQKIYAVEKDRSIIPLLQHELIHNNIEQVEIINQNFLHIDLERIAAEAGRKIVVIGNLPYNISSQILVRLIRTRHVIDRCILMFQREMVQRLTASPGCKDYGRLTVMLQYCAEVKKIAAVQASLFFPKPKVDSEVVEIRFKPESKNSATDEVFLFSVIKSAFSKRRKMLKNSIDPNDLGLDIETLGRAFTHTGIDPSRRAETLTVEEFVRLSQALYDSSHRQTRVTISPSK